MGMQSKNIRDTNNQDELRRRGHKAPDAQVNDTRAGNMDITNRGNDHGAILSRVQSDEQRARMTRQLQRSYGNSYVRHILNTVSTPASPTISRGAPLAPTAPSEPWDPEAERRAARNLRPAPPAPTPAPGTARQRPAPGTGPAAEQIESSNVQPVPPAPAPAPGTAGQQTAPGTGPAAEQIESSNVQPVPPAPAPAPGTAGQQPAPGTGSAAEQQVTPGTAVESTTGTAPGTATEPTAEGRRMSALSAMFNSQVITPIDEVINILRGEGPENARAEQCRALLVQSQHALESIRPSYESNVSTSRLISVVRNGLLYMEETLVPYFSRDRMPFTDIATGVSNVSSRCRALMAEL
jgi:hypothetical protein